MKKRLCKKATALVLSAALMMPMAVSPAWAAEKALPTQVTQITAPSLISSDVSISFGDDAYLSAITKVTVNGEEFKNENITWGTTGDVWCIGSVAGATGSYQALKIIETNITYPATIVISAEGYNDMKLTLNKTGSSYQPDYNATIEEIGNTDTGDKDDKGDTSDTDKDTKTIGLSQISVAPEQWFKGKWYFSFADADDYVASITGVSVNGTAWEANSYAPSSGGSYYANTSDNRLEVAATSYGSVPVVQNGDIITITAKGYSDLSFKLVIDEEGNASIAESGKQDDGKDDNKGDDKGDTGDDKGDSKDDGETKPIAVNQAELSSDMFDQDWYVAFKNADGYVSAITSISVNDAAWEAKNFNPSTGGSYYKDTNENRLVFAKKNFSSSGAEVLKSGDVITITATGYETLRFKLVIDKDNNASLVEDDSKGDPYELKVKLNGSFEAAIVGQKNYDGVSSATTSASVNKNSSATLYGALVEKGSEPTGEDWEELDHQSKINVNGSKSSVVIVPDTEKGTPENSDSGMNGVYMTLSSSVTLSGEPKDPGSYLVYVTVTDDQGRTATSNALPFRVYSGKEALADQITLDKLTQTSDGKYMWDIMEPWAISEFGSNVENEENSVRVPAELKAWYGSHESGTYGVLGYDLAWEKVEAGEIPQTLYIPNGCTLTMVNMKVLSSVHVVVENGGKLVLQDSTVQGIIDVQSGGTFSMNYNDFDEEFLTGASICGQLRMADGSTLENAAIYSHINYLANGNLTDRTSAEPVVVTNGNVNVKGQVFINGDAGGSEIGQTGLCVKDGTLTLADDAVLAVYGGAGDVVNTVGGTAIQLDNGTITGNGKVIAVGGDVLWQNGGNAVSGTGTISAKEAFLQGATASKAQKAQAGKAIDGDVTVTSEYRHVADGTVKETTADDPLENLYWKTGIDAVPNLDNYPVEKVEEPKKDEDSKTDDTTKDDDSKKDDTTKDDDSKKDDTTKDDDSKKDEPEIKFNDVQETAYYANAVQWAVEKKITNGIGDDLFAPDQACTRGQIVTFLWRAAGEPKASTAASKFTDVQSGTYYYDAVQWAVEKGIAKGMTDTTFEPNATCTRAQTVTFLWRAAGEPKASTNTNKFTDVNSGSYYYDAVQWAVEKSITTGTTDTTFSPNALCTRGQIVTFMYRDMA